MHLLPSFLALLASSTLLASATPRYSDLRQRVDASHIPIAANQTITNQTTCDKEQYTYQELAGYGFVASNATDKYGDTLGGYGSAIAIDRSSWKKLKNGSYTGLLWAIPDRGWNTEGTLNYQNRVHKFAITLTPKPNATLANPSGPNLQFTYEDTILFTGPDGTPTTGLDADVLGSITYPGFPILPVATFTGDGFGGPGPGGRHIPIDSEGLALASDGGFWVSDEYGPYIYHFSAQGRMTQAIMPPAAYIPHRNGSISFSADSPPIYNINETIIPANTVTGRDNNQGLEGLTISSDGKTLYALMQSALDQEGGPSNPYRLQARLLEYDISNSSNPEYKAEYVVTLPLYTDPTAKASKATKVAAQSEIHSLGNDQFLVLARDSGAGHGQSSSLSVYRHADIFDISSSGEATDIESAANDATNGSIASSTGVLDAGIKAAEYCTFLDYNVNAQLGRFGLHNGGAQDATLLNEKWESLATVPVDGKDGQDGEWFLFSLSDNDFITQDGHLNFGKYAYKDASGYDLDNQALVFQIQVPKNASPS
ncbi:hypothetical protein HO133_003418 [Letharia lupina]|uniref:Phytase-like domain-containing protein n=1 Tax=Letharia lupina TaxID=560253 RepID=A0A8H6CBP7_9LECA|nr:uncharacterized protein HO133_003418 [Letharia lupina]KAF6220286.1 hypothetical protein HO133_003418 [Letharia lupina]